MYYEQPIDHKLYRKLNKDRSLNSYFRTDKVGRVTEIFDQYYHSVKGDLHKKEWEQFYYDSCDLNALKEAALFITSNYDIDEIEAKKYVVFRVIGQTWNGMQEELNVIRELSFEFANIEFKKAPYEMDVKLFTDWEAYSLDKRMFGIQIKPESYKHMNTVYQLKAKAIHEEQRERYMNAYGVPHLVVYYEHHDIVDKQNLFNQINTMLAYNIKVNYER